MNSYLPIGLFRFQYFLNQVKNILEKAETTENPALAAFASDLRTPFFMLEALCRLYKEIHPHYKLKKLNKICKELEDRLGQIDYYNGFEKEFAGKPMIPSSIKNFLKKRTEEKTEELNDFLKKEKWIDTHKKYIFKIADILEKVPWLKEKEDTIAILNVYKKAIQKLNKKYKTSGLHFTDVENDVHELRRELRWLSIYPQALRGLIQLKPVVETPDFLEKYQTPEIIQSRYNIMPDGSDLLDHFKFDSSYYYALSWVIAELGKLKDNGLRLVILEESIEHVYKTSGNTEDLSYALCEEGQLKIPAILQRSEVIANTFFSENILENLIAE